MYHQGQAALAGLHAIQHAVPFQLQYCTICLYHRLAWWVLAMMAATVAAVRDAACLAAELAGVDWRPVGIPLLAWPRWVALRLCG